MGQFGNRIKVARLTQGFTQGVLARKVGIGGSAVISGWESQGKLPHAKSIPKLADALGIKASELAELWMADSLNSKEV